MSNKTESVNKTKKCEKNGKRQTKKNVKCQKPCDNKMNKMNRKRATVSTKERVKNGRRKRKVSRKNRKCQQEKPETVKKYRVT